MSDVQTARTDPATQLTAALVDLRADIWREYELVQNKIDSATRFRMVIVGWTMTAASVAPLLVKMSKLGSTSAFIALLSTFCLLLVIHKLAMDQLATSLKLGEHAKYLESEIEAINKIKRLLTLHAPAQEVASRLTEVAADALGRPVVLRRGTRKKRSAVTILVDQATRKLQVRSPSIATVATTDRLTWKEFLQVHIPWRLPSDIQSKQNRVLSNIAKNRWILLVQGLFLILGGIGVLNGSITQHEEPTQSTAATPTPTHSEDPKTSSGASTPAPMPPSPSNSSSAEPRMRDHVLDFERDHRTDEGSDTVDLTKPTTNSSHSQAAWSATDVAEWQLFTPDLGTNTPLLTEGDESALEPTEASTSDVTLGGAR